MGKLAVDAGIIHEDAVFCFAWASTWLVSFSSCSSEIRLSADPKVLNCAMPVQKSDDTTLSLNRYSLTSLRLHLVSSSCSFYPALLETPASSSVRAWRTALPCMPSTLDVGSESSGVSHPLPTSVYRDAAIENISTYRRPKRFPLLTFFCNREGDAGAVTVKRFRRYSKNSTDLLLQDICFKR